MQARIVQGWTKPTHLNRMSMVPISAAKRVMSSELRTSSLRMRMPGRSVASDCSVVSLISVAQTLAPSSANASAVARPMPYPAVVTNAVLLCKPCSHVRRHPSSIEESEWDSRGTWWRLRPLRKSGSASSFACIASSTAASGHSWRTTVPYAVAHARAGDFAASRPALRSLSKAVGGFPPSTPCHSVEACEVVTEV